MILDLNFEGKYVAIIGGGAEGHRKIGRFLDAGAKILVVSRTFLDEVHTLHQLKKIELQKADIKDAEAFVNSLNPTPDLLLAVTNDQNLNFQLAKYAKSVGCMVYAVDNPVISDFIVPALAKIDAIIYGSTLSAKNLFKMLGETVSKQKLRELMNNNLTIVAIGPVTAETTSKMGLRVDVMPDKYLFEEALIKLAQHWSLEQSY